MKTKENVMAEKGKNTLLIEPGNPRLLKAPVKDGSEYSLYLEYKVGYKEENGSCIRRKEGLSLRLVANPRTQAQRSKNKETIELARKIRFEREQEFLENKEGYRLKKSRSVNFLDYYQTYIDKYTKKDVRVIEMGLNDFKKFLTEKYPHFRTRIEPRYINKKMMLEFAQYITDHHHGTGISSVFRRFKKVILAGVEDGLFSENPCKGIVLDNKEDMLVKDILSAEEHRLNISAGEAGSVKIGLEVPENGGEYVLTAYAVLAEDTIWAEKGHEISFAQQIVKTPEITAPMTAHKAEIVYGDFCIGVNGEGFSMQFDKREGGVSSLVYNGVEYITRAPKVSFFRAHTDNDTGAGYPCENAQWQIAGKCAKLLGFETKENADSLEVTFKFLAPTVPSFEYKVTYIAYFDGRLGVKAEYDGVKGLSDMPVFAMDFKMKKQYDKFTFYGMGPDENYIDRNNGARLGVYTLTALENFTKYLNPQECGNRTGVRYVNVYEENGAGLNFTATENPFEMSVLPYNAYELDNAMHRDELPDPTYTWVRIAAKQMGVGGDDSWGAPVHKEFKINSEEAMSLEFIVSSL